MAKKKSLPEKIKFYQRFTLPVCSAIIVIWTLLIYYNSLNGEFVFDDESVVQNNEAITSLSNIPKFFTADEGFHKVIGKYYRPIVSTSYTIDYAIWGLNPLGYHITNLLIHIIACLLLLLILAHLFRGHKYTLLFSLLATLIFASHAVHTEAVSWISGRTDSLVTLFFFASFYFYVKFDSDRKNSFLYISLLLFFIGLLTKEMIITLPVIILLYDFVYKKYDKKYFGKNIKVYILFFSIAIVYLILRYFLLKNIPDRDRYLYFYGFDFVTVVGTMLKTIPIYLKLLLVPVNLIYHYNGTIPDAHSLFEFPVIISFLLLILIIVLAVLFYKKDSVLSFSLLFFLVSLMPVMNIIPTMNLMAERFLYMTSFALSIAFMDICLRYIRENNLIAFIASGLVIILLYSFLTVERNNDWKNNDTLYMTADNVDGTVLLVNCGNYYANRKQYEAAAQRYFRALEIRDNSVLAHHNLGLVYLLTGNLDSAEIQIKKGIEIDSLAPDGYFQLANIYQQRGDIAQAISNLEKLQTIIPDYKGSKQVLENLKKGDIPPVNMPGEQNSNQQYISNLQQQSFNLYQAKKYDEAIIMLKELIKADPFNNSGYLNNIGLCYAGKEDYKTAKDYYEQSFKADPKNVNALSGIADVELLLGNKSKALQYYRQMLILDSTNTYALEKIDSLTAK